MLKVFPNYPHVSELNDGVYTAKWYAQTLELEDGRRFDTEPIGVRQSKRFARFRSYKVSNGQITAL